MKSVFIALTFGVATAAIAQSDQPPAPEAPPPMAPAQPTQVAPGNAAPQRDARGIPVVSDPAEAPAGFNQPPQPGGTGAPANATPTPQPATENYPNCSRTVTDNCVQSYERGNRGPRA
ncbi:MAG: hypothetical protein AB7O91_09205 [Sphingomonas sp.]